MRIWSKYGLGGVLASLPVLWVNHPARLADAAYKPVQLVTAHRCGLIVPDSMITQDADAVRAFAGGGTMVTKLLGANTILEEDVRKVSFTRLVNDVDLADLRGIDVTTHFFQRWVPKAYEARMIVIGEHVTTAAIRAGSAEGHIDWRADYDGSSYELVDPPPDVLTGVRDLMCALDLRYAALDFVIRPDGQWTFLEINAGGQYGWIEDKTGRPLTDQLADLLAEGIS
jgi:glutathione synthase/RimK-type ligase-like ATP-grasp enzyme